MRRVLPPGNDKNPFRFALSVTGQTEGRGDLWKHLSSEVPRPQGGASRARSGEQNVSKGSFVHIVPLDPAYKAGLAGHVPANYGLLSEFVSTQGGKTND